MKIKWVCEKCESEQTNDSENNWESVKHCECGSCSVAINERTVIKSGPIVEFDMDF